MWLNRAIQIIRGTLLGLSYILPPRRGPRVTHYSFKCLFLTFMCLKM